MLANNSKAVVLAAGKGTRLRTEGCDLPKVMREALGYPLLHYVLKALGFLPPQDVVIVVGYQKEKVIQSFHDYVFAEQKEQLGTGHAVQSAKPVLEGFDGSVLVCCGDMPLVRRETYEELFQTHTSGQNACTILTASVSAPLPYGRIVRDEAGNFLKIVEDKDCTPEEKAITELNSGVYIFDAVPLFHTLSELKNCNAQGEYYLTDVPGLLLSKGLKIGICKRELGSEIIGVNTLEQLSEVEQLLLQRLGK